MRRMKCHPSDDCSSFEKRLFLRESYSVAVSLYKRIANPFWTSVNADFGEISPIVPFRSALAIPIWKKIHRSALR